MPTNIEIKARLGDFATAKERVAAMSDTPPKVLQQRDTFFRCTSGRLKLRELGTGESELIYYAREDVAGSKQSDYEITPVSDPESLRMVLARALGKMVVVNKTRWLYLVGQTRVRLDVVDGLGDFLELEVVLRPDQAPTDGHEIARELMQKLGIHQDDLLATAYADMLRPSVG